MKLLIYVLAYNESSFQSACSEYGKRDWAKVILIPSTLLYENVIFSHILLERKSEWVELDYVGFISWRASEKIKIYDDMAAHIEDLIRNEKITSPSPSPPSSAPSSPSSSPYSSSYDVIALYNPFPKESLLHLASRCHPRFTDIWEPLMQSLGFNKKEYTDINPAFYGNYWIAKPLWLERYLVFFAKLRETLDTLESIQDILFEDAKYQPGREPNVKDLMSLGGKPYYTYHPFIYERAPCAFFQKEKARVLLRK